MQPKIRWIFILLGIFIGGCSSEKKLPEETDVFEIRTIGTLATTEYTFAKVIKSSGEDVWYKFGDRSILMRCKARVKAGIDLSRLTKDDIVVNRKKITVYLPQPEIISFQMDPNLSFTEMENVNGFRHSYTQSEKNQLLTLGEKSIRANLGKTSMMQKAASNAEKFVVDFYKQLGYETVEVISKQPHVEEIRSL